MNTNTPNDSALRRKAARQAETRLDIWERCRRMDWKIETRPREGNGLYTNSRFNRFRLTSPGRITWDNISVCTAHRILDGLRPPHVLDSTVRLVNLSPQDEERLVMLARKYPHGCVDYALGAVVKAGLDALGKGNANP